MLCHVGQNGYQRANTQWIMQRYRQMMLFRQMAFQPHMTIGLPGNSYPSRPNALINRTPDILRGSFMPESLPHAQNAGESSPVLFLHQNDNVRHRALADASWQDHPPR